MERTGDAPTVTKTKHRTGGEGGPWVEIERPKPPKVADIQAFWADPPPDLSERCRYWLRQIEHGWLPNKYVSREGYYGRAEWFGVYIWEQLNVLDPAIHEKRKAL